MKPQLENLLRGSSSSHIRSLDLGITVRGSSPDYSESWLALPSSACLSEREEVGWLEIFSPKKISWKEIVY